LTGRRKSPASTWAPTAPWQREYLATHQQSSDDKHRTEPPGLVSISTWEKPA
jgi:hypothetical protein